MGWLGLVGLIIASDVAEKIGDKIEDKVIEGKVRRQMKYEKMRVKYTDDDEDDDYDEYEEEDEDDDEEEEDKETEETVYSPAERQRNEKIKLIKDSVPKIAIYDIPENLKCPLCGAAREKMVVNGKLVCRFCDYEQGLRVIRYEEDNAGIKKAIDDFEREEAEKKSQQEHDDKVSFARAFGWYFIAMIAVACFSLLCFLHERPGLIILICFAFALVVLTFVFVMYPATRNVIKLIAVGPVMLAVHVCEIFSYDKKIGMVVGWFIIVAFWLTVFFTTILMVGKI